MKKILFILSIVLLSQGTLKAQEIGIRLGEVLGGNNVAIDGVLSLGKFSRVHADVTFGDGVGIEAIWNVIYRPIGGEALNWYLGFGVNTFLGDPFILGIPGEIGIEYRFNVPISISLDWRPTLIIVENTDFKVDYAGLNIRYVFNR